MSFETLNKSFINGKWTGGESGRTEDILNPYDQSVITTASLATGKQLEDAFDIAQKAQKEWAKSTTEDRKAVLQKARGYLHENRDEIGRAHV